MRKGGLNIRNHHKNATASWKERPRGSDNKGEGKGEPDNDNQEEMGQLINAAISIRGEKGGILEEQKKEKKEIKETYPIHWGGREGPHGGSF